MTAARPETISNARKMRSLSREFIAPDLDVRESLHDAEPVFSSCRSLARGFALRNNEFGSFD